MTHPMCFYSAAEVFRNEKENKAAKYIFLYCISI